MRARSSRLAECAVLCVAALLPLGSACRDVPLVVVTLETDLVAGEDFHELVIRAEGGKIVRARGVAELHFGATEVEYPLSFSVVEGEGPTSLVTVEARDRNGHALVSQSLRISHRFAGTRVLRMKLGAACRFLTAHCLADQTCDDALCVTRDRTGALPRVHEGRELDGLAVPPSSDARHIQRTCRDFGATRGCGVERIAGGTFTLGDPAAIDAVPTLTVTVQSFVMDRYEVTVDRAETFRRDSDNLLLSSTVPYPDGEVITNAFSLFEPLEGCAGVMFALGEPRPVVCVDHASAQQFCAFEGGRLPTSTEWELAARHTSSGGLRAPRTFPWGEEEPGVAPCTRALYAGCAPGAALSPVGSFPGNGGLFDLAGNVAEWTSDLYQARGGECFPLEALVNPTCLPALRDSRQQMIVRGGAVQTVGVDTSETDVERRSIMGASIAHIGGESHHPAVGFRCVYDL
jgi:formylglycine-generating enzyme required for sulfatase activity